MNDLLKILSVILGLAFTIIAFGVIFALPIMLCWNYVIPKLFMLPEINLLQAWCLSFLTNILFKSSVTTRG